MSAELAPSLETVSFRDAIHYSMGRILADSPDTILLGQGVSDPTRIFGTVAGLLEKYGSERVIECPVAEESMTGIALGAAICGLFPVQTHIRMDFLLLAMNQLVNHVAKYRYMYGGAFSAPMLIRTIVGRSWGQGPQHSQSLQSLLAHIPGLTVVMPASAETLVSSYLEAARNRRGPVVSIEHRFLYDTLFHSPPLDSIQPSASGARLLERGTSATLVAASYMVQEAQRALRWLRETSGIQCDLIDLHRISQIDHSLILESVRKTGRLLICDTGWVPFGLAAEVCRGISETDPGVLKKPVLSLGMAPCPAPTSHELEREFYPDVARIVDAVHTLVGTPPDSRQLPDAEWMSSQRKKFRGPF